MTTVLTNGGKPQGDDGQEQPGLFQRGGRPGPGRPKGSPNRTTVDARLLKRKIFECWDRIDGDRLLDDWAREHFGDFLKVVVRLLPRYVEVEDKSAGAPAQFPRFADNSTPLLDELLAEAEAARRRVSDHQGPGGRSPGDGPGPHHR